MADIADPPPPDVAAELAALEAALDARIPAQRDGNLLIATWNIRAFASLTREWTAGARDSPKRDLRGLRVICAILARFDVIAVQELKGDLRALRDALRFLGPDWTFLMTDVTAGDAGAGARLAFLWRRDRVAPSGLAAELVVPQERLDSLAPDALREQFARTPYAVSFRRGRATFILVTLHILFGDRAADRVPELREIAGIFADWARRSSRWHHNLLCLGDFNIDREGSPLYDAFTATGLTVPEALRGLPRTIFDDPDDPSDDNYYDQIAWFVSGRGALIDLEPRRGGNFDFMPFVYRGTDLSRLSISFRVSDHLPLWMEFDLPAGA